MTEIQCSNQKHIQAGHNIQKDHPATQTLDLPQVSSLNSSSYAKKRVINRQQSHEETDWTPTKTNFEKVYSNFC